MDKDLERYYKKGQEDKWNFDLRPLIKNFDFYEFCDSLRKIGSISGDYGGFVVITNQQFIAGYNNKFGSAAHVYSNARVMKDLKGGGTIDTFQEGMFLSSELDRRFIVGRIVYEPHLENDKLYYDGFLHFDLSKGNFPKLQYEQFLKFYEKYNEDLKYTCSKFNFYIGFSYRDENGKVQQCFDKSLDLVKEYIHKHLFEPKEEDIINEIILNESRTK